MHRSRHNWTTKREKFSRIKTVSMSCLTQTTRCSYCSCTVRCELLGIASMFFFLVIVLFYLWLIPLSHGYLGLNNSQREMFSFCLISSVFLFFCAVLFCLLRVCSCMQSKIHWHWAHSDFETLESCFHLRSDVLCVCCLIWLHRISAHRWCSYVYTIWLIFTGFCKVSCAKQKWHE